MKIMILVALVRAVVECVGLLMGKGTSGAIPGRLTGGVINALVAYYFFTVTVKYQAHKA